MSAFKVSIMYSVAFRFPVDLQTVYIKSSHCHYIANVIANGIVTAIVALAFSVNVTVTVIVAVIVTTIVTAMWRFHTKHSRPTHYQGHTLDWD